MRKYYEPTKDASIYEEFKWKNSGLDEILEVGKNERGTHAIRSLIQFDIASISQSIVDGKIPPTSTFDLRLYLARADWLPLNEVIDAHPVSQSWEEGSGYFYQNTNIPYVTNRTPTVTDPIGGFASNDGATWRIRESGTFWASSGSSYLVNLASTTLTVPISDVEIDVTDIVSDWISGSYNNNGLVLKFPDNDEQVNSNVGAVKFFSRNTHTIYSPQLVAKWNNQTYITGSLPLILPDTELTIRPKNLKPSYKLGESAKINLHIREKYVLRTFSNEFSELTGNNRLTDTSYFSIVDMQSNTTIIPFDDSTRINCNGEGSYIEFDIAGMYPGRYYKLMFKSELDGVNVIHDRNDYFRIDLP
jgi:hypothetical protein